MTPAARIAWAAGVTAALGCAALAFDAGFATPEPPASARDPVARVAASAPASDPLRPVEIAASPAAPSSPPAIPRPSPATEPAGRGATPSHAQRYAALARSGDPKDAMAAFGLAASCVWAREQEKSVAETRLAERREEDRAPGRDAALHRQTLADCGDLSDAQIADRVAQVTKAAEAGVPMAALRLASEGPFGDPSALYMRFDDPAVVEWRQRIIDLLQLAAAKGDVASLMSLANMYASGRGVVFEQRPEEALQYAVAQRELRRRAGTLSKPGSVRMADAYVDSFTEGLTREQVMAAAAAGLAFAARVPK